MSLLIKALDKAQAEKAQAKNNADKKQTDKSKKRTKSQSGKTGKSSVETVEKKSKEAALSLSPSAAGLNQNAAVDVVPEALRGSAADISQKEALQKPTVKPAPSKKVIPSLTTNEVKPPPAQVQAANVFTAKRTEPTHQTAKLALIIGFLALLIMAALFYWYQSVMNIPDIVIPSRPVVSQEMPAPLSELPMENEVALIEPETLVEPVEPVEAVMAPDTSVQEAEAVEVVEVPAVAESNPPRTASVLAPTQEEPSVEETLTPNETVVDSNVKIIRSNAESLNVGIASESASIKITQAKTESGVNPVLMRAYEAYIAGNDNQAQQDYKQVLQRYGPNVDAMLGLGAIAARQGRLADANGWYRKVLEMEPRNDVAKAGMISLHQKNQPQNSESSIKSMMATTPDDANLHAALGDVYAGQEQWAAAQQAYFDAYRINSSAENAFNLGVSLDQLGKSQLALPYYQEALNNADQSTAIDTAALEARISSIQ
ncbi:MAG: hypothetical protein COB34_08145 [Methylophilaceae bacterium]|nr:MAG: hypothetical protein COB34_08145 [Methylophilaceae bacterium]